MYRRFQNKEVIVLFIDFDIPIPDNLPQTLLDDLDELQDFYDKDDWCSFDLKLDGIECRIKNFVLSGRISRNDAIKLFHRYGNMI